MRFHSKVTAIRVPAEFYTPWWVSFQLAPTLVTNMAATVRGHTPDLMSTFQVKSLGFPLHLCTGHPQPIVWPTEMGCSDWLQSHAPHVAVSPGPHLRPVKKLGVSGKERGEVEAGTVGSTLGMLAGREHVSQFRGRDKGSQARFLPRLHRLPYATLF